MYTFLPVLFHQAAPSPLQPQVAERESAPVAAPSWPAPSREREEVIEGKFCLIRVARGFSRKAFAAAGRSSKTREVAAASISDTLFDAATQDWPSPARPAAPELKLPRRKSARTDEVTAQPSEVGSLQC